MRWILTLGALISCLAAAAGTPATSEAAPPDPALFSGHWWAVNPTPGAPDAELEITGTGHALSVSLTDVDDDLFCDGAVSATGTGHVVGHRQLAVNFVWTCQPDGASSHRTVLFRLNPVADTEMAYFYRGELSLVWHK